MTFALKFQDDQEASTETSPTAAARLKIIWGSVGVFSFLLFATFILLVLWKIKQKIDNKKHAIEVRQPNLNLLIHLLTIILRRCLGY